MADSKQADIDGDMLHPVKEKDHTEQKQKMIISGHHVLGSQIDKRDQIDTADFYDIALVTFGDGMGQRIRRCQNQQRERKTPRAQQFENRA